MRDEVCSALDASKSNLADLFRVKLAPPATVELLVEGNNEFRVGKANKRIPWHGENEKNLLVRQLFIISTLVLTLALARRTVLRPG